MAALFCSGCRQNRRCLQHASVLYNGDYHPPGRLLLVLLPPWPDLDFLLLLLLQFPFRRSVVPSRYSFSFTWTIFLTSFTSLHSAFLHPVKGFSSGMMYDTFQFCTRASVRVCKRMESRLKMYQYHHESYPIHRTGTFPHLGNPMIASARLFP